MNAKRRALLGSQHSRQSAILPHGMNRLARATSFTCVTSALYAVTVNMQHCL